MPTREELHKLIETLPEGAIEAVHRMLTQAQVWPPPPPTGQIVATQMRAPDGRPYSSTLQRWDGDTFVSERKHALKGYDVMVIERIRVDGQRLIYKHEVRGPGGKREEREITFDLA